MEEILRIFDLKILLNRLYLFLEISYQHSVMCQSVREWVFLFAWLCTKRLQNGNPPPQEAEIFIAVRKQNVLRLRNMLIRQNIIWK